MSVEQVIAEGDLVAVRVSAAATHKGDFRGIAPTGKGWEATASAWYEVQDGKISDFWVNWDWLAIMHQHSLLRERQVLLSRSRSAKLVCASGHSSQERLLLAMAREGLRDHAADGGEQSAARRFTPRDGKVAHALHD